MPSYVKTRKLLCRNFICEQTEIEKIQETWKHGAPRRSRDNEWHGNMVTDVDGGSMSKGHFIIAMLNIRF